MTNRQIDEEAIFHFARDLADTAKRSEYLQQVCGADQELRERIQGLLDAHEKEQTFLKSNVQLETTAAKTPTAGAKSGTIAKPGEEIGRFKLLQQIGEGGFGVVFMAEQHKPIRRKVALKVIKPGMDTKGVVARFEAERQALAMMDHPNIAKVLDGGTTDSGRPYFVMELVKGVPITDYCDQKQLSADQRLELFITVCKAIQHAHQKGIIHRDLKPSNILVALHDGKPVVKVIDFGVAKAVNQQLTDKTLYTAFGQMVGTPQYMSPEQAEISGLDIDTRSDVYSLGVILYELLTGSTPLETERLRKAGYAEIQRLVKESEPQRPSTRLSTSGEKLTAIAKHRSVAPDRLSALIKGDLDWVVMKALEKDRSRRYSTPVELADDVNRYLTKQPVEAYPPSSVYKMKKFVRRNKGLVFAASAFAVIMITATTVSTLNWNAAVAAQAIAEENELAAKKALQAAETAQAETKEALKAKQDALEKAKENELAANKAKAEAEAAKAKAEEALENYRERLMQNAISAAFVVDDSALNEVIEDWTLANFDPKVIDLFKGMHEHFTGNVDDGDKSLKKGFEQAKDKRLASLIYSIASVSSITKSERETLVALRRKLMKEPSGQRHKEFEDTLRGWITVHYDPLKSTELLKPNNNRRWPIRRVMYAHALALAALCEGDLKMAQQANTEMTIAKERLVDEVPLAVTTELWVLTVLYSLTEEPEQRVKIKGIADKIASNLDGHPEYWLCQNLRCHYYTLTDDTSLKELYEEKVQNNWVSSLDSTYFYRTGEDSKALRYLKDDFRDMPHARISSACIAAELRKIKEARKVYDEIDENWNVRQYRARAIDILLYLGDLKEAKEAADKIIEESEDDYNHTFVALKLRLDLISANRKSTEDLEKMILENSPSQTDKCMGYYTLGLICLARNEEAAAKGFFKTAVDCNQFIYPQHEMAKALLKRRFGSTNDEN